MKKTMYAVYTMPMRVHHYNEINTVKVCYTRYKLWAHIRQIIACWKLKPDHMTHLIVCRPSAPQKCNEDGCDVVSDLGDIEAGKFYCNKHFWEA